MSDVLKSKTAIDLLEDLIAFSTVSADPNMGLIEYCADILNGIGAETTIIADETGKKANLYATVGPKDIPGVLLSGHTDVVPVEGQDWNVPPFEMTRKDGKLYGRGTTDMKGFIACALLAAKKAASMELAMPLHLAFSYDEEIGCVGVRSMIDLLSNAPFVPKFCIVGEPTLLKVATGHKGKTGCRATCVGVECHSALAPKGLNALYLATDLVAIIRDVQHEIEQSGPRDADYEVPYSTLHAGRLNGGVALNIVPNLATLDFEIRNLPDDDAEKILETIKSRANDLVRPLKAQFPAASIEIEIFNTYPAMKTAENSDVVNFVKSLTRNNDTFKVAFGTEGGLFSSQLGIPTVICGPGSMDQGHKPDEFIEIDQMNQCDAMLDRLVERLRTGF